MSYDGYEKACTCRNAGVTVGKFIKSDITHPSGTRVTQSRWIGGPVCNACNTPFREVVPDASGSQPAT